MPKIRDGLQGEFGFTLIEVVVVLVALGILAMVAIPKYMDLTQKARESAAQGVISEVKGLCSLTYAKLLLAKHGDTAGATASAVVKELGRHPKVGSDVSVSITAQGNKIEIAVTRVGGAQINVRSWYVMPDTRS